MHRLMKEARGRIGRIGKVISGKGDNTPTNILSDELNDIDEIIEAEKYNRENNHMENVAIMSEFEKVVSPDEIKTAEEKDEDYIKALQHVFYQHVNIRSVSSKENIFPESVTPMTTSNFEFTRPLLPKERQTVADLEQEYMVGEKMGPGECLYMFAMNRADPYRYNGDFMSEQFGVDKNIMNTVFSYCSAPLIVRDPNSKQRIGYDEVPNGLPYVILGHQHALEQAKEAIKQMKHDRKQTPH